MTKGTGVDGGSIVVLVDPWILSGAKNDKGNGGGFCIQYLQFASLGMTNRQGDSFQLSGSVVGPMCCGIGLRIMECGCLLLVGRR